MKKLEVSPRFELGSLDSESRVLTITPWDLATYNGQLSGPSVTKIVCSLFAELAIFPTNQHTHDKCPSVVFDPHQQKELVGSSGIWTRDLSHPKRESYP